MVSLAPHFKASFIERLCDEGPAVPVGDSGGGCGYVKLPFAELLLTDASKLPSCYIVTSLVKTSIAVL